MSSGIHAIPGEETGFKRKVRGGGGLCALEATYEHAYEVEMHSAQSQSESKGAETEKDCFGRFWKLIFCTIF